MIEIIIVAALWYLAGILGGVMFLLTPGTDITVKSILKTLGLAMFGPIILVVFFIAGKDYTIFKHKE